MTCHLMVTTSAVLQLRTQLLKVLNRREAEEGGTRRL